MYRIANKFYSTGLRQKAGELIGALELSDFSKEPQLPYFIAAPLLGKKVAALTQAGIIDINVSNLLTHWTGRPCLLDLRFVKFDDDAGSDASWLSRMFERYRQFNGLIIPVADLRTNFYRIAAMSAHSRLTKSGVAMRVTLSDLARSDLQVLLETQLKNLGGDPADCIIVLDLTDADLSQPQELSKFVAETIFKLRGYGAWAKIIIQATNFPLKNPAPDDGSKDVARREMELWQFLVKIDPSIRSLAMFGDFGPDNAHIDFKAGGRPIPHLRYATYTHWIVSRGNREKGYNTMREVAKRIVNSGFFSNDLFSSGDEFIAARARDLNGVGNPMIWRSVNINRHMTLTAAQLGELYGTPIPANKIRRRPLQEKLFVDHSHDENSGK